MPDFGVNVLPVQIFTLKDFRYFIDFIYAGKLIICHSSLIVLHYLLTLLTILQNIAFTYDPIQLHSIGFSVCFVHFIWYGAIVSKVYTIHFIWYFDSLGAYILFGTIVRWYGSLVSMFFFSFGAMVRR